LGKSAKKSSLVKSLAIATVVFGLFIIIANLGGLIDKVVIKTTKIGDYKLLSESLLGLNGKKNILLLFMNNAEARTGGGFIGTVGYVTVQNGKIDPKPVRSVYYYDWKFLDVNYREDTKGMQSNEGTLYNLRDGNSSLDWRSNGKRAAIIFEKESGLPVDIVISITPEVLKYLLGKFGPIDIPEYNRIITKDNLLETIQLDVEYGTDKRAGKDPKTILSFVGDKIIERIASMQTRDIISSFEDVNRLIARHQLLLYSFDEKLARILNDKKMDGSLIRIASDYLIIAESNYSVDKSNAFIDRVTNKKITIAEDGTATVELIMSRLQTQPISFEYIDPHHPNVITNLIRANKSTIKLALPKGANVVSTSENTRLGKIDNEGGYDVYIFNSELVPLEKSEYRITYLLPFKYDLSSDTAVVNNTYQLQSGGWPYRLIHTIQMPQEWRLIKSNINKLEQKGNQVIYDIMVDSDQSLSFTYGKK